MAMARRSALAAGARAASAAFASAVVALVTWSQVPEAERGVEGTPDHVLAAEVLDGKQDARPQALQRVVVVPADVVPSTVRWRTAQRVGEAKSSNDIEEVIWVHASMQRCTLAAGSPSISGRTGASRQAAGLCLLVRGNGFLSFAAAAAACGARWSCPDDRGVWRQYYDNGNGRQSCHTGILGA